MAVAYPERIDPARTSAGILALHLKRYEFAAAWCTGEEVLDAGCGAGYGTALLAAGARRVVGVDRAEAALSRARSDYARPNVEFVQADLHELPFPDASFGVVCAFETIEHLDDQAAFLAESARVLRPSGVLIVSTPRAEQTTHTPSNPFHRVELSTADLERLLRERFADVHLYGQRRAQTRRHRLAQRLDVLGLRRRLPPSRLVGRLLGTPATAHVTADKIVIARDDLDKATELVAVCRKPRV